MSFESMPMDAMKVYQGSSPRPEDFDEFWKAKLECTANHNAEEQLVPAEFQVRGARCFHLYYKGTDGARIHAKYMCPADGKAGQTYPVIFQFHGYTGDSGDWWEKLSWIQQGFAVAALDCRGQAGESQDIGGVTGTTYLGHIVRGLMDGPDHLLYVKMFMDVALLTKIVKSFPEIDETRMSAFGGSQGGALSLVCAALTPEIKKVAVQYPFLSDYKRVYDMDSSGSAYEEFIKFFRANDPRHKREEEFFHSLGYIDVQNFASKIQAKVLWGMGLADPYCPPSTQFSVYNKLTSEKRLITYPEYGHEFLPYFMDECVQFFNS